MGTISKVHHCNEKPLTQVQLKPPQYWACTDINIWIMMGRGSSLCINEIMGCLLTVTMSWLMDARVGEGVSSHPHSAAHPLPTCGQEQAGGTWGPGREICTQTSRAQKRLSNKLTAAVSCRSLWEVKMKLFVHRNCLETDGKILTSALLRHKCKGKW